MRPRRTAVGQQRICLVTETYPPEINGVSLTLARLTEGLRQQGYDVLLVRPRQKSSIQGESALGDPSVTLVPGIPLPGYRGLRCGLPAGAALTRLWSQQRPHAVYVATEGPLGWSAVQAARRLAIPVFSGFHTNFHSYSKHYHAGWLRDLILWYLCRFHTRTNGTVVSTPQLRDRLRLKGVKNVTVLDRGVDSRLFSPERRSLELRRAWHATESDVVVLYVGRLAPEKNLALAVESYRAMQRLNDRVNFVIVGDGPQRTALQKNYPDLIFCGQLTGEQLAQHYASADVFLFPSETETFGNVILEAMASGLAVVAYDHAAAGLHITNGANGILVPFGNRRAFIDAAARLPNRSGSLSKMRRQAREHAASLDWRGVVEQFAALLLGETSAVDARHNSKSVRTAPV